MLTIINTAPEVQKILFDRLKDISDDEDFILGVMSIIKHDDDFQTIIDGLDNGELTSQEDILTLSLLLSNERNIS